MVPALLIIGGLILVLLLVMVWALWAINPSRISEDEFDKWARTQVHKVPGDE